MDAARCSVKRKGQCSVGSGAASVSLNKGAKYEIVKILLLENRPRVGNTGRFSEEDDTAGIRESPGTYHDCR